MLVKCPECDSQISDKAVTCPRCGYPVKNKKKKNSKKRRLPNGFGQITEIKNRNLRKPFRVMVTVGKTDTGKPICKLLQPEAYFETYNDAYSALIEYNKDPYEISQSITLEELYKKWSTEYFKSLKSESSSRTVTSAWAYCSVLYTMEVQNIRARHIKGVIEDGSITIKGEVKHTTPNIKARIKSLFNLMLDYAVEYEIVDKNYARTFNLSDEIIKQKEEVRKAHIPFTEEEINKLWDNISFPYVDVLLIQCYSGWRPQELGLIRLSDVDFSNMTFRGGLKTEAGKNRIVPIHPKIQKLVLKKYNEALQSGSQYLLNCVDSNKTNTNTLLTYDKYQKRFEKIITTLDLNPDHRAHDGRVHFVTMAKKYNVDEYAIKYMVGHSISDITERVYTKRNIDWLISEIKKIS